jgi:hypothetical protein
MESIPHEDVLPVEREDCRAFACNDAARVVTKRDIFTLTRVIGSECSFIREHEIRSPRICASFILVRHDRKNQVVCAVDCGLKHF